MSDSPLFDRGGIIPAPCVVGIAKHGPEKVVPLGEGGAFGKPEEPDEHEGGCNA